VSADFETDLRQRLEALDETTASVHLRDAPTIRRRGRQRARRQTAAAVAATLAVVGIGVAAVTGLADRAAEPVPVGPVPSVTVQPTPAPEPTTQEPQGDRQLLQDDVLVPAAELPTLSAYGGETEPWTEAAEPYPDWAARASCGLSEGTEGTLTLTAASLDAQVRQSVQVYEDDGAATAALAAWMESCTSAGAPVTPAGAGPASAGRAEPADQEFVGSVSSAVREGNVLVVVDLTGNIGPGELDGLKPQVAEVAALLAGRVAGSLGGRSATLG
jgi:hypothetical protein